MSKSSVTVDIELPKRVYDMRPLTRQQRQMYEANLIYAGTAPRARQYLSTEPPWPRTSGDYLRGLTRAIRRWFNTPHVRR